LAYDDGLGAAPSGASRDIERSVTGDQLSPRGGIVRAARRPPGWQAPGPRPPAAPSSPELWPAPGEDLCWLAGDWRILQRIDGHRWSLDDLMTAWLAGQTCARPPARLVDLGCGIGTVLLFNAWRFAEARAVGVEAQAVSVELARRSLAWNGAERRCEVRHGDFRDPQLVPEGAVFDLVTGTPPYFPDGTGIQSTGVQKAPCRFEHRGGIEDYCVAAARLLAPGGRFVACQASSQAARVLPAARASGLEVARWLDVVPRAGKPPLFAVVVMARPGEAAPCAPEPPFVVRGEDTQWTDAFRALRADMGMPPGIYEPKSPEPGSR
jgi:tRNA1(Val) A37 N6-methylase TrmN6